MTTILRPIAVAVGLMALPLAVFAHFKLLEPAEWVRTSDLGDPQKAGPCGLQDTTGDNAKLLTNASTKATGGSKLHLKIQETIYHSGHYRTWAQIQSPPQLPVIADGLFPHYPKPGEPASKRVDPKSPMLWEADVELPNINCPKCTLQVIEFMADHPYNVPGGYSYHHCAALEITADPAKPIDSRWPASK
jgi:hypothetical protein